MDLMIKKSLRKGVIGGVVLFLLSFLYGGIYTEIIKEGLEFSFVNLLAGVVGALFFGAIAFVLVFLISLVVYLIKKG